MTDASTNSTFRPLVALLRLAVNPNASHFPPGMSLTADEWREVYCMAAKHAVIAIAWDGVEHMQAQNPHVLQSLPADLMGKWFADVQTIVTANSRMAKQTRDLQEYLASAGFASITLKGASMATYYPIPAHRQSADIDLWVLPASKGQSLSERRNSLIAFLHQQPDTEIGEVVYHHIETMIDGTDVEFHVTPTWLCNPVHNRRLQRIFAQTEQLTPEQQELYALLHAFRHIYHDGLALRHLLDYWLITRTNRSSGIMASDAICSKLGLIPFAHALRELGDNLFDQSNATLSPRARHLLSALPSRQISSTVKWDYPSETIFVLPWRAIHFLWRKTITT